MRDVCQKKDIAGQASRRCLGYARGHWSGEYVSEAHHNGRPTITHCRYMDDVD